MNQRAKMHALFGSLVLVQCLASAIGAPAQKFTNLVNFKGTGGLDPGVLVQGFDGNLYATDTYGGTNGWGTAFKVSLKGTFTILHSFCARQRCSDGNDPLAVLFEAANGNFYSTTSTGGNYGAGTVFKITPHGSLTTLYSFRRCSALPCQDGNTPGAALIQATDGNFYGTTDRGGTYNRGTLFQITQYGHERILHSFSSAGPVGTLLQATDGNLYGTKSYANGSEGSIFKLDMSLRPFVETLPTSGEVGTKVIILGTDLTGATFASFNGVAATFKIISASEITTNFPAGTTSGTIEVMTPSGTLSGNVVFRVP